MTWVDELARVTHPDGRRLIGASFRGVPFFVEDSNRTGGRRNAKHQFIDADQPVIDDLGKEANEFRLQGYVLGDDYMIQRDQLLSALQDVAGPGDLVHPYFGHLRAQVGPVSLNETQSDGGIATFQIEFSHAPVASSPSQAVDLDVQVRDLAARLVISNRSNLVANSTVIGEPAFALESLSDDLTGVSEGLLESLSPVVQVTQELALMSVQIDVITTQAATLVRTPGVMLDDLIDVTVQLVESTLNAPLEIYRALMLTYELDGVAPAIGTTETRDQERVNQILFADALRLVLVTEAARIITDVTFTSIEVATSNRDRLVDALDELATTAGSDTFADVVNLRSSVLRAIPGDDDLARIETVQQNTDIPSLALSYRRYGNVDSAEDIVARNQIRHPAYVSGELNVLTNV